MKLVNDGTYDKLLAEWGLGDSGIPNLPVYSKNKLKG